LKTNPNYITSWSWILSTWQQLFVPFKHQKMYSCHMDIAQCSYGNVRATEDPEDELGMNLNLENLIISTFLAHFKTSCIKFDWQKGVWCTLIKCRVRQFKYYLMRKYTRNGTWPLAIVHQIRTIYIPVWTKWQQRRHMNGASWRKKCRNWLKCPTIVSNNNKINKLVNLSSIVATLVSTKSNVKYNLDQY